MGPSAAMHASVKVALGALGIRLADAADLVEAQALAARLIGPDVVTLERMAAVQAWTGLSVFGFREEGELTGLFAFLLLNARGRAVLLSDALDGRDPDLGLLSRPGERPSAYYGWGFAGSTRPARRAVVTGAAVLRGVLPQLPFYCRAATEAGRRAVTEKLGYRDVPGSSSGLLGVPALADEYRRAA
jgi:hypothetical protein